MNNEDNISKIAQAVANANANGNAVPAQFKGLVQELREEQLAENVVVEHGLLEATSHDINEEVDGWKPSEEVDFDADENLVDMDIVSGSLRDIFND
jgi:methionine aminopeptidase